MSVEDINLNFLQIDEQMSPDCGLIRLREEEDGKEEVKSPLTEFAQQSMNSFCFSKIKDLKKNTQKFPWKDVIQEEDEEEEENEKEVPPIEPTKVQKNDEKKEKKRPVLSPIMLPKQIQKQLPSPLQAVHSPSHLSPSNKAAVTTDSNGNILIANTLFSQLVGSSKMELVNASLLDLFMPEYKKNFSSLLNIQQKQTGEEVLQCGKIIRLQKSKNESVASAVWVKRKTTEHQTVYIWVFDEIKETCLLLTISEKGKLEDIEGNYEPLLQYKKDELLGQSVSKIFPSLLDISAEQQLIKIQEQKYFGCSRKNQHKFPVITKLGKQGNQYNLYMISMPSIAGMISVFENGTIQSCNSAFTKYLFGYSAQELIQKVNIQKLLPAYNSLIEHLKERIQGGKTPLLSASISRKAASSPTSAVSSPSFPLFPNLPTTTSPIYAVHKDGTQLNCDVQLRRLKENSQIIYAIWISFDRDSFIEKEKENQEQKGVVSQQSKDIIKSVPVHEEVPTERILQDYQIMDKLGEGAFGSVYKAKYKGKEPIVVLKYITKARVMKDAWVQDEQLGLVSLEIQILNFIRNHPHPNIVQLNSIFQDQIYFYIEMAIHGKGMDLFDFIEQFPNIKESEIQFIFKQTCQALQYLHQHKIVHRDIKDENIIIDNQNRIQLIDFGSAAWVKEGKKFTAFCGTLDYCSPEVLLGQQYEGPPQDIWAAGILLYTLIYKENPFYNVDEILERNLRVPFILSRPSLHLIQQMLNRKLELRPSIEEVLLHPWLNTK